MMRSMLIDPDGVGTTCRNRVQRSRLRILTTDPIPWFPNGFDPQILADRGFRREPHRCEDEPVIALPTVLVFDVEFYDRYSCRRRQNSTRFQPYWTGPVLMIHNNVDPPDQRNWREATPFEGLCAVAEYPEVGSVRVGQGWHQSTGQAYHEGEQAVMNCNGSEARHHRMYISRETSPEPPCVILS